MCIQLDGLLYVGECDLLVTAESHVQTCSGRSLILSTCVKWCRVVAVCSIRD